LDKLEAKLKDIKGELKLIEKITNKDLWINDLKELEQVLNKK